MATVTTLPATFVSGAVLTAEQQNDLRGAFRVLQVVTGVTNDGTTSSTTTLIDTKLTQTITPSSTSSKILVIANHPSCEKTNGSASNGLMLHLFRGATDIGSALYNLGNTNSTLDSIFSTQIIVLDSPNSVAAQVYKTQFSNIVNAASVKVQYANRFSTIVLMEISA